MTGFGFGRAISGVDSIDEVCSPVFFCLKFDAVILSAMSNFYFLNKISKKFILFVKINALKTCRLNQKTIILYKSFDCCTNFKFNYTPTRTANTSNTAVCTRKSISTTLWRREMDGVRSFGGGIKRIEYLWIFQIQNLF